MKVAKKNILLKIFNIVIILIKMIIVKASGLKHKSNFFYESEVYIQTIISTDEFLQEILSVFL